MAYQKIFSMVHPLFLKLYVRISQIHNCQGIPTPAHKHIDKLLEYVKEGKVKLDDIITHRLPITSIADGYSMVKKKEDNCVKVVLDPWAA